MRGTRSTCDSLLMYAIPAGSATGRFATDLWQKLVRSSTLIQDDSQVAAVVEQQHNPGSYKVHI